MDRAVVGEQLAKLIAEWGAADIDRLRPVLRERLAPLSEARLAELITRTQTTGDHWGYHPGDPFVREISRYVMNLVLGEDSGVEGAAHLEACRGRPAILAGNHLSYVDANVLDGLSARIGHAEVMDRLATVVGPKVYTHPIRRLASLCFGTIKTPQSSALASGEAVMSPREVARLAGQTLRVAQQRVEQGDALLIFPEGSRSRTGAMGRCLPAVARYLDRPDVLLLPWAHFGSEKLVPIEEDRVYSSSVRIRIGRPISIEALLKECGRNRPLIMDVVGFSIADLLPLAYRGVYAATEPAAAGSLARAREIALVLSAQALPECAV